MSRYETPSLKIFFRQPIVHIFALCGLFFIACTPEATPFPVDIPTADNVTSVPSSSSTIRYALAANTDGYMGDLAFIQASAQVEQLTDPIDANGLGNRYDLLAAYGDLSGGIRSPITPHVTLVVNPTIPPLDDPFLRNILYRSLNTQAIIDFLAISGTVAAPRESSAPSTLRTELANAGWPDGLRMSVAYAYTPGAPQIIMQFQAAGIQAGVSPMSEDEIRKAFDEGQIQAALISWKTPAERTVWSSRFGEENVIDLYSVPISYIATPGLQITFTPGGWPIASR